MKVTVIFQDSVGDSFGHSVTMLGLSFLFVWCSSFDYDVIISHILAIVKGFLSFFIRFVEIYKI